MNEVAITQPSRWTTTRHPVRSIRVRMLLLFAPLLLVAGACGGGGESLSDDALATIAVAEQNQRNLDLTNDLASTELLDGNSGAITSLSEVVTGDRPILVWYWAPN